MVRLDVDECRAPPRKKSGRIEVVGPQLQQAEQPDLDALIGQQLNQEVEQADANADADTFAYVQQIGAGFLQYERNGQHDAGDERHADRRFT